MIREIRVKNFRLLKDVQLELEQGRPTVLIGPNSAGKSTLLEVLHFFRSVAEGGLRRALIEDRGGADMVKTAGAEGPISMEVLVEPSRGWPTEKDRGPVRYGFAIEALGEGSFAVAREWLDIYEKGLDNPPLNTLIRDASSPPRLLDVNAKEFMEAHVSSIELCIDAIRMPASFPSLENVRRTLLGLDVYGGFDTRPQWKSRVGTQINTPRSAATIADEPMLNRSGSNLVNVLHFLRDADPRGFSELVDNFKAEFPFFRRFTFPAISGRIQLGWEDERFPDALFYADQMSDGMIYFLLILASVSSRGKFSAAVGLDEPESHLHPSAERRLVYWLERAAKHDAVVVATHSSSFLDHLSEPARSVRICEAGADGTRIETLESDKLDYWLKDFSLSELRRRGHLDAGNRETREE